MRMFSRIAASLFTAMLLFIPVLALAQQPQQSPMLQPVPADKAVRVGKLPNGLTYYIRHNEYPKGQAEFFIAQNVGSILENDDQRGLAHFLEHMCFNGTTHFPGNQLRDWLETVGVKFGQNLNAYTSIDQTVYNISAVPTARESVQDSCLLILHDWANDLTLDPKEIDSERKVIHEEWRSRNSGSQRMFEQMLPTLYPGSKYGYRMPIGTMEVVDNFPHQALRDYYETWYRPDQQGIIVVGDVDVDRIEGKIKEMFADIEMPANAPERTYEKVPDTPGTIYAIGSDPEQPTLDISMMFKYEPIPTELKNTYAAYIDNYVKYMIRAMLSERLHDLGQNPDAPFTDAGASFGNYLISRTKGSFSADVTAKGDRANDALETVYRELLRAQRGGFTQSEYQRARDNYLAAWENLYKNRDTRKSRDYVNAYVNAFTTNAAMPSREDEYELIKQVVEVIPLEAINQTMAGAMGTDNRAVMVMAPQKEGYTVPTEQDLAAVIAKVEAETIEAHVDNVKTEPLIAKLNKPGKIKSERKLDQWGATEWTLSNGAKVIVKPTKFKDDEILMKAYAPGGFTEYGQEWNPTLITRNAFPTGLGSYTSADMGKYLAGKMAGVDLSLDEYERGLDGMARPSDLPTLMELIYATMTETTVDPTEFEAKRSKKIEEVRNRDVNPQSTWIKSALEAFYESPRRQMDRVEDYEKADRKLLAQLYKDMTGNAADFTFVFVGNVDESQLRPLVEKYIASLPGNPKKAVKQCSPRKERDMMRPGTETSEVKTKMETPMTYVYIAETGTVPVNLRSKTMLQMLGTALTNRLIKNVREDMGAVYSISASADMGTDPERNAMIQIPFPMKPEMKGQVLDFIRKEINDMASNLTEEEVAPAREFMLKNAKSSLEENYAWLGGIYQQLRTGQDLFNNAEQVINSITVDDLRALLRDINAQGNYRTVVLEAE